MMTLVSSIFSLLSGIGIILIGSGFLGTLLGMRATLENFSEVVTGLVMSAYFLGFIARRSSTASDTSAPSPSWRRWPRPPSSPTP